MWCSLISLPTGAELYLSRPVCSQWCHGWRWLVFYLSMPSHDQFRGVTERAPAWMLKVTVPSFSQSTSGIVTQRGPSPALHPFLPCCSSVAWKPELNIGPHSPNFPSSSSKAFLSSSLRFLSPLSPSSSSSSHSSPCLSFSFPLPIPHGGDFRDFGWRNGKHSPEQRKPLLSKAISTMSHLMTQWRSLLGGCVCVCLHPRNTQGPSSALCSFIQLGAPTCSEGSPSNSAFDSHGSTSALKLRASSQGLFLFCFSTVLPD